MDKVINMENTNPPNEKTLDPIATQSETLSIESEIIAISDTHFGKYINDISSSKEDELEKLIKWLDNGGDVKLHNNENGKISAPNKFILCGDIFEFWAPKSSDEVFFKSFGFLSSLKEFCNKKKIEIIYLYGNHDYVNKVYETKDPILLGTSTPKCFLKEYYEHPIGNKNFLFLHGHQIDWGWFGEEFLTLSYSLQLLTWIGVDEKKISSLLMLFSIIFFPILVLGVYIYRDVIVWSILLKSVILPAIIVIFMIKFFILPALGKIRSYFIAYFNLLEKIFNEYKLPIILGLFYEILLILFYYFKLFENEINSLNIIFIALYAVIIDRWTHMKHDGKSFKQILPKIENWLEKWLNEEKIKKPYAIIYGHSHIPAGPISIKDIIQEEKPSIWNKFYVHRRIFDTIFENVNSIFRHFCPKAPQILSKKDFNNTFLLNMGCWLREGGEDMTFVHIDTKGEMRLFKYDPNKNENIAEEIGNKEKPYNI